MVAYLVLGLGKRTHKNNNVKIMPKYSVIGGNKNHYKNNNEKVIRL